MATQKFEVYGSFKNVPTGIDAYMLSNKSVTLSFKELLEAICLHQHKTGVKEEKCTGYRITSSGMDFYFEK